MGATIFNILAITFFPLIAATGVYYWKHWQRINASPVPVQILLGIGPVVVFGTVFRIFDNQTKIGLIVANLTLVLFGIGFLILAVVCAKSTGYAKSGRKWVAVTLLSCLGLTCVWFFGRTLARDFFLPRHEITGVIDKLEETGSRSRYYHVYIDGTRFQTTGDVFETLKLNAHIRAQVGAGSDNIFKVELISDAD